MEPLLRPLSVQASPSAEEIFTFTIPQEMYEVCDIIPGEILASIISSKPDALVKVFDTNKTSYARWMNHVVTSDIVREKNWKTSMYWVRDQGTHETGWAITAAELISAVRYILRHDAEYVDYSAQFLVDFADRDKATERYMKDKLHYCFKYSVAKALEFVKEAGIPQAGHWKYVGCRPQGLPIYRAGSPHVYVNSCVEISSIREALPYLEFHPIAASLALFTPDYYIIKDGIYRGPMYKESVYEGFEWVNIYAVIEENGETIALVKAPHGTLLGDEGYFGVSVDVEMVQVPWEGQEGHPNFGAPRRLLSDFSFPTFA
ncbi:unnamed protein product [Microthlaspi erraticum]|uniref:Peptidase C1A papain C-terminal domain-containing protein n=1 Tax=Microthlaspi erraticum TaxID=1685480 RepID=A0A6D2KAL1_9BRAS|nr:unnamed protein product [Microthlaspi erraticum]